MIVDGLDWAGGFEKNEFGFKTDEELDPRSSLSFSDKILNSKNIS